MYHCILVKWNESAPKGVDKAAEYEAFLGEIQAVFNELLTAPEIHGVDLIRNVIDRPNRYDLMIRIDMEEEYLPVYDASAPHKKWKAGYGQYIEKKAIFDYAS